LLFFRILIKITLAKTKKGHEKEE